MLDYRQCYQKETRMQPNCGLLGECSKYSGQRKKANAEMLVITKIKMNLIETIRNRKMKLMRSFFLQEKCA